MIEYLQDIETLPVEEMWEITSLLANAIQLTAVDKLMKEGDSTKADEIISSFNKWIMPPQQQAYIKYPRYDFL